MAFIGAKSQIKSIASMFWNDDEEPFTISPKQHEEINVMARPEEAINHDEDCQADLATEDFDQCLRLHTEANMYNSSFAGRFCHPTVVSGLAGGFYVLFRISHELYSEPLTQRP